MPNSKLQKIANFDNAVDAGHLRSILLEHDIPAFVDGAHTMTTLSRMNYDLRGVDVLVKDSDALRARKIIDSRADRATKPSGPWYCGACREVIEGQFKVCWSCAGGRAEVEQPLPKEDRERLSESSSKHPSQTSFDFKREPHATLLRSMLATILGVTVLPLIGLILSVIILLRELPNKSQFSPVTRKLYFLSWTLNLVGLVLLIYFWL